MNNTCNLVQEVNSNWCHGSLFCKNCQMGANRWSLQQLQHPNSARWQYYAVSLFCFFSLFDVVSLMHVQPWVLVVHLLSNTADPCAISAVRGQESSLFHSLLRVMSCNGSAHPPPHARTPPPDVTGILTGRHQSGHPAHQPLKKIAQYAPNTHLPSHFTLLELLSMRVCRFFFFLRVWGDIAGCLFFDAHQCRHHRFAAVPEHLWLNFKMCLEGNWATAGAFSTVSSRTKVLDSTSANNCKLWTYWQWACWRVFLKWWHQSLLLLLCAVCLVF